jgi:hypothetical protein
MGENSPNQVTLDLSHDTQTNFSIPKQSSP